jgi:hypothetical protein
MPAAGVADLTEPPVFLRLDERCARCVRDESSVAIGGDDRISRPIASPKTSVIYLPFRTSRTEYLRISLTPQLMLLNAW